VLLVAVLEDIDFTPGTLRIARGDSVRWVWKDDPTPHNVRSRGTNRFQGSGTRTAGSHRVRFNRAGTYRYVCTVHIGMDGRIVVR
jgi:plastocyanin